MCFQNIFITFYCLHVTHTQVPRVFIGGKFVGGGSEVRDFQKSGELVSMLKSAGAL